MYVENDPFKNFEAVFDAYDKDKNIFVLLKFLEQTQKIKTERNWLKLIIDKGIYQRPVCFGKRSFGRI